MADNKVQPTPVDEQTPPGAATGRFVKKLFLRKEDETDLTPLPPEQGIARVPATVLTVEYVDSSEGLEGSMREAADRLRRLGEFLGQIQETQGRLVAALNQQAKDIAKVVETLGRRIDRLHALVEGAIADGVARAAAPDEDDDATVPASAGAGLDETDGAPEVSADPAHQNAWRIARVLVADLEAYHADAVREGILQDSFEELLRDPLERARKTYQQRAGKKVGEEHDYFSRALDELIARKRAELEKEGAP